MECLSVKNAIFQCFVVCSNNQVHMDESKTLCLYYLLFFSFVFRFYANLFQILNVNTKIAIDTQRLNFQQTQPFKCNCIPSYLYFSYRIIIILAPHNNFYWKLRQINAIVSSTLHTYFVDMFMYNVVASAEHKNNENNNNGAKINKAIRNMFDLKEQKKKKKRKKQQTKRTHYTIKIKRIKN